MNKIITNHTIQFASLVFLGVLVFFAFLSNQNKETEAFSAELGIAEMSPNGAMGGYAIPASGASCHDGCGPPLSCTLVATPNIVLSGGNVTLEWFGLPRIIDDFGNVRPGSIKLFSRPTTLTPSPFGPVPAPYTFVANIGGRSEYIANPTEETEYRVSALGGLLNCSTIVTLPAPIDLAARLSSVDDQLATVPYDFTFSNVDNVGTDPITSDVRVALQFDYKRDGWDGNGVDGDFHVFLNITAPENFGDSVEALFPGIVHNQTGNWRVRFLVDTNSAIEPAGAPSRANNVTSWRNFTVTAAPPANWCHQLIATAGNPDVSFFPSTIKYYSNPNLSHISIQSSSDRRFAGVKDEEVLRQGTGDGYLWAIHYNRDDAYMSGPLPDPTNSAFHGWINVTNKDSATLDKVLGGGGVTRQRMVLSYRRNTTRPECGSTVVTNTPTISATNCTISEGNNSCFGNLTWTSDGVTSPVVYQTRQARIFSTNPTGTNQSVTLLHGFNRIWLRDGGVNRVSANPRATCAAGLIWNGSICVSNSPPPPPEVCDPGLTTSATIIRAGDEFEITWNNCANSCTFSSTLNGVSSGDTITAPYTTVYSIDCPGGSDPDDEVTVIVLPRVEEN